MAQNNHAKNQHTTTPRGITMTDAKALIEAFKNHVFITVGNDSVEISNLEHGDVLIKVGNLCFQVWNVRNITIDSIGMWIYSNVIGAACQCVPILDYTPEPEPVALVPTFDDWMVSVSNLGNSRSRTTNLVLGSDKTLDDVRRIIKARAKRGEVLTGIAVTRGAKTIHVYTCPRQQYLSTYNDHSWTPGHQNFARRIPVFQGKARYDMIYTRKGVF